MKVTQLLEMAKRTTPDAFYKMAVDMYGAEKAKSVTMPEVKAIAVKNDVQIPPYVVKNKVARGRFNLKPEGSKEAEPAKAAPAKPVGRRPDPVRPSADAVKSTVDRMIKDLGPVKYVGKKEMTDDELKAIIRGIYSDLRNMLPSNMSRYVDLQDIDFSDYKGKKTWQGGLRDWGAWQNPDDAYDEEDYDWQELTPEWRKKLRAYADQVEKKYPNLNIRIGTGEKNWVEISVENK